MEDRPDTAETAPGVGRRIGRFDGAGPGPLLICTGALHGNEPAGVFAIQRVLAALEQQPNGFRGRLVGLAGNLVALRQGSRFLDVNLNRAWLPERLRQLEADAEAGSPAGAKEAPDAEWREQQELLRELRAAADGARGAIYFLDLHTSSAEGTPFACIGDTLRNRRFARAFPVPVILGLEEQIDGALLEHLNNAGFVTLGFEGGQHQAAQAIENHEAAIWLGLASAGCLTPQDERVQRARELLRSRAGEVPSVLEIRYRHGLRPTDGFRMRPGFHNFCEVVAGEVLADDTQGDIQAFYPARVLLPLYQGQGNDGFFLAREVSPFWLRLSRWLRRLRLDRLVVLLPGVRRHPQAAQALLVDRRVARWFTIEVFHLLGYRKRRQEGELLVVSRRAHDLRPPSNFEL